MRVFDRSCLSPVCELQMFWLFLLSLSFSFMVLIIEPRALHMVGTHSTIDLCPQALSNHFWAVFLPTLCWAIWLFWLYQSRILNWDEYWFCNGLDFSKPYYWLVWSFLLPLKHTYPVWYRDFRIVVFLLLMGRCWYAKITWDR